MPPPILPPAVARRLAADAMMQEAEPLVSIVVPTRNRRAYLEALLDALERQDAPNLEVIVVDDASSDGTWGLLEGWQRRNRRAIRQEVPLGSYAARNTGWRAARGRIIAFTDDDCLPQPGWASGLVAALRDPAAVGAQGLTRAEPGEVTPFTHQIDQRRPGPPYRTANIAYRREVLEELRGFRDDLRWYADNIFGLRARQMGPIVWAPDAVVLHPPRPREWRDRAAWQARFAADAVHRGELHALGVERLQPHRSLLPVLLWVIRPVVKQGRAHIAYFLRHPQAYVRSAAPMLDEKKELLLALRKRSAASPLVPLPPDPCVSVVIVTRARQDLLEELLAILDRQTYVQREVVVVDTEASERTRDIALNARAVYLAAPGSGLGAARQAGVERARGDVIAFVDDDCLPRETWMSGLVGALLRHPELAGVQGRTEAEPGPLGSHSISVTRPDSLRHTCNIAYRADVLAQIGGFDRAFVGWFEDTALGARVETLSRIGFAGEAVVTHRAMPRASWSSDRWRALLADERRLATAYPSFYRRHRGPSFHAAVVVRWLLGSPLKTLLRELPRARTEPVAYARLMAVLAKERWALLRVLMEGSESVSG